MKKVKFIRNEKMHYVAKINGKDIDSIIHFNHMFANETAIILKRRLNNTGIKHLILEGDFRKEYEKCISEKEIIETFTKYKGDVKTSYRDDIPLHTIFCTNCNDNFVELKRETTPDDYYVCSECRGDWKKNSFLEKEVIKHHNN